MFRLLLSALPALLCCLRCFAACANVNPLGLARAVADSLEKYMAMGFLCFLLFSYTHTHTYTPTLAGSKRARARAREKEKKSKAKVRFIFFFVVYVGEILCPLRSLCVHVHPRLSMSVCVCVCFSLCLCVCEFVCGTVFGGLEPVASYCLTCALDLLSILFVIIVVVTVVVVALSLPHCECVFAVIYTDTI